MDTTNNITKKQLEILTLLYRFRFLNRSQIQKLLNQKDFKRIIINLNQLTNTNYIRRYYNSKTVTVPAIYSLGLNGKKYVKENFSWKIYSQNMLSKFSEVLG